MEKELALSSSWGLQSEKAARGIQQAGLLFLELKSHCSRVTKLTPPSFPRVVSSKTNLLPSCHHLLKVYIHTKLVAHVPLGNRLKPSPNCINVFLIKLQTDRLKYISVIYNLLRLLNFLILWPLNIFILLFSFNRNQIDSYISHFSLRTEPF